jgi:hypothetical protein
MQKRKVETAQLFRRCVGKIVKVWLFMSQKLWKFGMLLLFCFWINSHWTIIMDIWGTNGLLTSKFPEPCLPLLVHNIHSASLPLTVCFLIWFITVIKQKHGMSVAGFTNSRLYKQANMTINLMTHDALNNWKFVWNIFSLDLKWMYSMDFGESHFQLP